MAMRLRARGQRLPTAGNANEATRERELARRLSSAYDPSQRPSGEVVRKGLERVKNQVELPQSGRIVAAHIGERAARAGGLATFISIAVAASFSRRRIATPSR